MKKHSAENKYLKIQVQEEGAELCSLINKKTGIEHIWQANPDIWGSHAPNLFPVIGVLKDGKFSYDGKEYSMPKHGFIRHNQNLILKEKADHRMVFELIYSKESLEIYPFKFDFKIEFELQDNSLIVNHRITNLDSKELYFSLGGHPAFNICLFENEKIEDYSIEFDQKMSLDRKLLNNEGLISDKTEAVLRDQNTIRLDEHIFDRDALIFENIPAKKAGIISREHGKILSMDYSGFRDLGIWAKPGAEYVCIEPWLGMADIEDTLGDITSKKGIISLSPEKEFTASYSIHIH